MRPGTGFLSGFRKRLVENGGGFGGGMQWLPGRGKVKTDWLARYAFKSERASESGGGRVSSSLDDVASL
jgi:hypothetical protein